MVQQHNYTVLYYNNIDTQTGNKTYMLLGLELVLHHVPLALPEPTCLLIINIMSTQGFKKHKNKLWVSQGTGVRKHS